MVIPPVFFADPTFLHICLSFRSGLVCLSFILEGNAEPLRNLMLGQVLYKMEQYQQRTANENAARVRRI